MSPKAMEELVGVNGEKAQMRGLHEMCEATPLEAHLPCLQYSSSLTSVKPGEDNKTFRKIFGQLK